MFTCSCLSNRGTDVSRNDGKTAFYLFSSLTEIIVAVMYIAVNLNVMFGIQEFRQRAKEFKERGAQSDGYQMQPSYSA